MRSKISATIALIALAFSTSFAQQAAKPGSEASKAAEVEQIVTGTLHRMYEAEKRKDLQFIFSHLSEDFAEVSGDGRIYRRSDIAAEFNNVVLKDYALSECVFNLMTADSAYITCNMKVSAEYKGQSFPTNMRVSWVWTQVKNDWKLRFEQATLIPPDKSDSPK